MQTSTQSKSTKSLLIKDHFAELFKRSYIWLGSFILLSIFCSYQFDHILNWLIKPLGKPIYYTSPSGGFDAIFGISTLFGFIFSLPILIYQIIKFIEPAYKKLFFSKVYLYPLASLALASIGVTVSYYIVFPLSLSFLSRFSSVQLTPLISTSEYFSFVTRYLLGFAVIFQLPLIVYLLSLFIDLTATTLLQYFRHVLVACFVFGAILTPTPDIYNQSIIAMPIILLYLASCLLLYLKKTKVEQT